MKKYDKLIFVSNSNTATSPMAQAILESKYLLEDILVESKGLVVLFPEPMNPKAEDVLAAKGLTLKDHASRPLTQADIDPRTLILTMNGKQKSTILTDYHNVMNLYTLNEYVSEPGEVPNPYGKDLEEYEYCFDQIYRLITKLVVTLNEEELMS